MESKPGTPQKLLMLVSSYAKRYLDKNSALVPAVQEPAPGDATLMLRLAGSHELEQLQLHRLLYEDGITGITKDNAITWQIPLEYNDGVSLEAKVDKALATVDRPRGRGR